MGRRDTGRRGPTRGRPTRHSSSETVISPHLCVVTRRRPLRPPRKGRPPGTRGCAFQPAQQYAYGRDDAHGVRTLERVSKDGTTTLVIADLRAASRSCRPTASGPQALLVYDGRPTALIASGSQATVAYDYNPFGVPTVTVNSKTEAPDPYGAPVKDHLAHDGRAPVAIRQRPEPTHCRIRLY